MGRRDEPPPLVLHSCCWSCRETQVEGVGGRSFALPRATASRVLPRERAVSETGMNRADEMEQGDNKAVVVVIRGDNGGVGVISAHGDVAL